MFYILSQVLNVNSTRCLSLYITDDSEGLGEPEHNDFLNISSGKATDLSYLPSAVLRVCFTTCEFL